MTSSRADGPIRLVKLTPDELRPILGDALGIYVAAMRYPADTTRQRGPMWMEHMLRQGWRCIGAFTDDTLLGVAYGYRGAPGQWWHDEVRRGLARSDPELVASWLIDYFELTELHVHPNTQGRGIGRCLLQRLLSDLPENKVLLSTPEGPSKAWRLYRSVGFVDLLRDYRFSGDPRSFAVLGRTLPLAPGHGTSQVADAL